MKRAASCGSRWPPAAHPPVVMRENSTMRLRLATILTGIAASIVAGALYWLATASLESDHSTDDSGAVQGRAIFMLALIVGVATSIVVFPTTASRLARKHSFTWRRWTRHTFAGIGLLSFVASVCVSLALEGSILYIPEIITLSIMLFCISTMFLLPLSFLWKALVVRITNRSNRSRVERAPVQR